MGKRVLLLQESAMAVLFRPRGKSAAIMLRLAGPTVPEDAKIRSAGFIPALKAFGLVLESAEWSDLVLTTGQKVNGIPAFTEAEALQAIKFVIVDNPAQVVPEAAIEGYDDLYPVADAQDAPPVRILADSQAGETPAG